MKIMAIFVCLHHNLLLTKSQTAKVCMLKGQLASCNPAACQGLFCNQLSRVQMSIPLWVWKKPRDQHPEGRGGWGAM